MKKVPFAVFIFIFAVASVVYAGSKSQKIVNVYEKKGAIYAVYEGKGAVRVSKKGTFTSPKLADDGRTAGWMNVFQMGPKDGLTISYDITVSSVLSILRGNKVIQTIHPKEGPFIWDWRFYNAGKQVVMKTGSHHGSGFYELYDIDKKKFVSIVEGGADQKPEWAKGLE